VVISRPLDQVAYPSDGCESRDLILPYLNVGSGDLCFACNILRHLFVVDVGRRKSS
jgi:hypothetical protein